MNARPDATADTGEYQVVIPADLDDGVLAEGAPCPSGPREPVSAE